MVDGKYYISKLKDSIKKGIEECKSSDQKNIVFGSENKDSKIIQSLAERFVGGKFNM